MSSVLEAVLPENNLTTFHQDDDWPNYFDKPCPIVKNVSLRLPELSMPESMAEERMLTDSETSSDDESSYMPEIDVVDDIESPIMPAQNEFAINLTIERIERGLPSICDEVEL